MSLEISETLGEAYYCDITATRRGRHRQPCQIKAGVFLEENRPVIRLIDASGTPCVVALLTHEQADQLGDALKRAARVKL